MTHSIKQYLQGLDTFLNNVFEMLYKDKINVSSYELDHLCYRVETIERYNELKQIMINYGELIGENIIAGRPIAIFVLNEPIIYKNKTIKCFELPAPKEGVNFKEGFEHVEFVIDIDFQEFIEKYKHLNFLLDGKNKIINPDIYLKYNGFAIKFHHYSIEYVVKVLEK